MIARGQIHRAAAVLLGLAIASSATAQYPVRICPLGDSILESFDGRYSSRYYLDHLLRDAGYAFDFVGHNYGVFLGEPADPDFDQAHEAYSGWRVDHHLEHLEEWLPTTRPDIVFIHLGTNDLISRHTAQSIVDELAQCVALIRAQNPHATVLISQLIPMWTRDVGPVNALIPTLAELDTPESRVVIVDHFTPFVFEEHMLGDGLHPNDAGERLMAQVWFDALQPFLTPADREFTNFGAGCSGGSNADAPAVEPIRGQAASLGNPFTARLEHLVEDAPTYGILGFSDVDHFGLALPIDLGPLGAAGCSLLIGPDIVFDLGAADGSSMLWTLPVPDDEVLVGNSFFLQTLILTPRNALGVIASNAAKITVVAGR